MKKLRYLKTIAGGTKSLGTFEFEGEMNIGTAALPITFSVASETKITIPIYSKYTGDTGYFRGLYSLVTYNPATVANGKASVYGVMGQVILAAGVTHTEVSSERLVGVDGRFENKGTMNGDGIWVAGVRGALFGAGTWTKVKFVAAVLGACQISTAVTDGVYSAFQAYADEIHTTPDAVISVWGGFTTFLNLKNATTCFADTASEKTGAVIGHLKVVDPNGDAGVINVYAE